MLLFEVGGIFPKVFIPLEPFSYCFKLNLFQSHFTSQLIIVIIGDRPTYFVIIHGFTFFFTCKNLKVVHVFVLSFSGSICCAEFTFASYFVSVYLIKPK